MTSQSHPPYILHKELPFVSQETNLSSRPRFINGSVVNVLWTDTHKKKMEPENHLIQNTNNHLPNPHSFGFHVNFQGCTVDASEISEATPPC